VLAGTDPGGTTAEEVARAGAGVVVPSGDTSALCETARAPTANGDEGRRKMGGERPRVPR